MFFFIIIVFNCFTCCSLSRYHPFAFSPYFCFSLTTKPCNYPLRPYLCKARLPDVYSLVSTKLAPDYLLACLLLSLIHI